MILFTDPGQQTCHVLALWDSVGLGVGFTGSHPSFLLYGPCGFSIVIVVADESGQSSGVFSSCLTNPQTRALHCDSGSIASAKGSRGKGNWFLTDVSVLCGQSNQV